LKEQKKKGKNEISLERKRKEKMKKLEER